MLIGHNPQSIIKTLGTTQTVVYKDIKYSREQSREYIYDVAKGNHVLMFKKCIEILDKVMMEAWTNFNDPKVTEKQKVSYLRLIRDCPTEYFNMIENGPTTMAIQNMTDKVKRLGITKTYPALPELTKEQAAEDYANSRKKDEDYSRYNFDNMNNDTTMNLNARAK
jgi:hypothetical protein